MQFLMNLFLFLFGMSEDINPKDISNKVTKLWENYERKSPADLFTSNITNDYFPLSPGTILNYEGKVEEGVPAKSTFDMTANLKDIMGIECREVHEVFFVNEVVKEEKLHWFSQDVLFGNVWYFGLDYKLLNKEGDIISTEGSWSAGVNFSFPGVMMKASPSLGDEYYHEYAPQVAQDQVLVLSASQDTSVPFDNYEDCLMTLEFSELSAGKNSNNFYAKGVGLVKSHMISGGMKYLDLVSISHYWP